MADKTDKEIVEHFKSSHLSKGFKPKMVRLIELAEKSLGRCGDCEYWERGYDPALFNSGVCHHPDCVVESISTFGDFGCVHWAKKQ